jgi:lysophospholipase L1-like esterase
LSYLCVLVCVHLCSSVAHSAPFALRPGDRVLFLGDSNTFAGRHIAVVEGYLVTRFPDAAFDVINLGLPSETASGLSEADHPYPRPSVHDRLDRALGRTRPNVVVIAYGMNDGIYAPFAEDRFRAYRDGMRTVIDRVKKVGATPVLLTPAPFDPAPLGGKVQPATGTRFSWLRPFADYDGVLARYSEWLLTLRQEGLAVADAHGAIARHLAQVRRADPAYRVSGDGIHPNAAGLGLVARELLAAWHAPADVDAAVIDIAAGKAVQGRVEKLTVDGGRVSFAWTSRVPMPPDAGWPAGYAAAEGVTDALDRYRLTVRGATAARYTLAEDGRTLGEVTREELASGVDLLRFAGLTTNRRAAEVWPLVEQRVRVRGLAWLTDVGHRRPDTPKGPPLAEGEAKAAELLRKARELAKPVPLKLALTPVGI